MLSIYIILILLTRPLGLMMIATFLAKIPRAKMTRKKKAVNANLIKKIL